MRWGLFQGNALGNAARDAYARELNDVFLLPFEMAVKQARAGSVMPAYHDLDNESCHASRRP